MLSQRFQIIGVGPASKEYLLPLAKRAIQQADCLIGAKRLLAEFGYFKKEKIALEGNFARVIQFIKQRQRKKIAVLVSGDPGLYSFLGNIHKVFKKEEYNVIPGISTLQLAFARIKETWQDAKIISLHARKIKNLSWLIKDHPKVFLFTDSKFLPEKIATYLLKKKIGQRKAYVFENLGNRNENIISTDLKRLATMKGFGLCVMIIMK